MDCCNGSKILNIGQSFARLRMCQIEKFANYCAMLLRHIASKTKKNSVFKSLPIKKQQIVLNTLTLKYKTYMSKTNYMVFQESVPQFKHILKNYSKQVE